MSFPEPPPINDHCADNVLVPIVFLLPPPIDDCWDWVNMFWYPANIPPSVLPEIIFCVPPPILAFLPPGM